MRWIDATRGLCGIAVVAHHAVALAARAGSADQVASTIDDALAPFRMPLLMLLSGAVAAHTLDRPLTAFTTRRWRTVVWPYLLWSVVILAVTGTLTPGSVLRIATVAPTYLWFLQFLVVYAFIAWVLRRVGVPPLVLALPALVASGFLPEAHRADRFAYLVAFFLVGVALGSVRYPRPLRGPTIVVGGAAAIVGLVAATTGADIRYNPLWAWAPLGGALALIAACSTAKRRVERANAVWDPLARLGRNAVVVYVTHLVTITLVLRVIGDAGLSTAAVLVATMGAALGVAALLASCRRLRVVDALFVFPVRAAPRVSRPHAPDPATRRT